MWKCEEILSIFLIQQNSWHFFKSYNWFYTRTGILQGSQNSFKKKKILIWFSKISICINMKKKSDVCAEVKLFSNFSKIAKICNIFPNKGTLLNRLSWTKSYTYDCNSFTDSCYSYTLVSPPSFSPRYSKPVWKTTLVYMNENCLWWRTVMARNTNQWTNWFHSQQN